MSRTANQQDAEDLSQEILYALLQSSEGIRDEAAFYGFMWSVAGNVCRAWYRKKARRNMETPYADMVSVSDGAGLYDALSEEEEAVTLLRRELSMLSQKYRRATVLYYMHGKSCHEISGLLDISESMVKYLLFQSRNILKEGMTMERTYGTQSYEPKTLSLYYMGEGPNRFWDLINDNKIRQNILWACLYDALCEQEIALQIGVSLPYLEDDITVLCDAGLLQNNGKRYRTNLIILTEAYEKEKVCCVRKAADALTVCIKSFLERSETDIRAIGYRGSQMSAQALRWQMTTMLLFEAYYRAKEALLSTCEYPKTAFGEHAYVWGVERPALSYCHSCIHGEGMTLSFMDWLPGNSSDHHDFWGKPERIRIYEKILRGYREPYHETEEAAVAELIRLGYLYRESGTVCACVPVFSQAEFAQLCSLQEDTVLQMTALAKELHRQTSEILKNHVPTHLKKQADDIAAMHLFGDLTTAPTQLLLDTGYLSQHYHPHEKGTVYAVLA